MPKSDTLGSYLNDHLAASVAAARLMERHILREDGTRLACCLRDLLGELKEDQALLLALLRHLGSTENPLRRISAWVHGRLQWNWPEGSDRISGLTAVQALEALTLVMQGRVVLWASLHAISPAYGAFGGIDFLHLKRCAEDERDRLEQHRLEAVYAEFGVPLSARVRMGLALETSQAC